MGYTTGDLDTHDIAVDRAGRTVFVNTLFSCLATVSDTASFSPLWKPPFISRLAAEDRCHLNGLAVEEGRPRFVTTVSRRRDLLRATSAPPDACWTVLHLALSPRVVAHLGDVR